LNQGSQGGGVIPADTNFAFLSTCTALALCVEAMPMG